MIPDSKVVFVTKKSIKTFYDILPFSVSVWTTDISPEMEKNTLLFDPTHLHLGSTT